MDPPFTTPEIVWNGATHPLDGIAILPATGPPAVPALGAPGAGFLAALLLGTGLLPWPAGPTSIRRSDSAY